MEIKEKTIITQNPTQDTQKVFLVEKEKMRISLNPKVLREIIRLNSIVIVVFS